MSPPRSLFERKALRNPPMYNANKPTRRRTARRSGQPACARRLIAIVAAAVVILVIGRASGSEYGIDPTGAGRVLGLDGDGRNQDPTRRGGRSRRCGRGGNRAGRGGAHTRDRPLPALRPQRPDRRARPPPTAYRQSRPRRRRRPDRKPEATKSASRSIAAARALEIKLVMDKGAQARFEWTVERRPAELRHSTATAAVNRYQLSRRAAAFPTTMKACSSPPSTATTAGSGAIAAPRPSRSTSASAATTAT